jgi:hypothetical protein
MRVVVVEPHHLINMPGFELRTLKCVGCGDVEKRPYFDSERVQPRPALIPEAVAPKAIPEPAPEASAIISPAPPSKPRSIFASIARLRAKPGEL